MSRFKFRAWDKTKKVMVVQKDDWGPLGFFHVCAAMEEEPFIMQSTGLRDKNGVEIYEGDILNFAHDTARKYLWYVDFRDGSFVISKDFRESGQDRILNQGYVNSYTVIGNIHENPDLLNP